jgi:hypothetical protein
VSKDDKTEATTNFLIAEFNALQERATSLEQVKSNQVNFFLIVVAGATAGLSGLSGVESFALYVPGTLFIASLVIFLLGIVTLYQSVNYSLSIVSFYRRCGRIRRWFMDNDPTIAPYLAFHAGDDQPTFKLPPSYLAFRGADAVLLIVNTVALSALIASLEMLAFGTTLNTAVTTAIVAGLLGWLLQHYLIYLRLDREEKRNSSYVHFPQVPVRPHAPQLAPSSSTEPAESAVAPE